MADITQRLASIKAGITQLANMAGSDRAEAARQLAKELTTELDHAMQDASAPQVSHVASPPKAPRHGVERCPVCSLRSFTFQKGRIRESVDAPGTFEGLYRCLSCAHEGWREID